MESHEISKETKYLAIKVAGLSHWLWFERAKVTVSSNLFTGKEGWGDDGAFTEVCVNTDLIEGEMASDTLQYL